MPTWECDPTKIKGIALEALLKVFSHHRDNVVKTEKYIGEKNLRTLMPNLSKKEIKEEIFKHERRWTPRFKAFQILSNKIEDVVQSTLKLWKSIFDIDKEK